MQHSAKSEEMGLKLWSGSLIVNPLRGVPRSRAAQNRPMKNKKRFFARPHAPALAIAVVLSVGLLLAACDDGEPGDPVTKRIEELTESPDLGQAASANGQIDGADLQQANYLTESSESGQATLENGQFRAPVAPGSASELVIRLDKWVLGDLDGQAGGDAAAITIESPGGSGEFFYLHGLVNEGGALRDADFVILGDRIRVEGLSIHDGIITVAMLDRAPGEPFAAPPSVPAIRQFRLQNGKLTEVDEFVGNIAQGAASANGQIDGADLQQANYLTESSESGQATLENGQFRAPVAPGSASELVIRLDKWVLGDLDGQAGGDAAAITIESPGGSGEFFYLHGLVNEGGALRDADFVILGDRIRVEGLSIHDGIITVAMLDRAPGEPFAAPPSVPAIRQFRLQNGKLTEVDEFVGNIAQGCELTPPDTALVIVLEPGSGEAVGSGFAVNGCSRTFESNINWRLLARSGEVLAEGFAMGGGVYGPGPFSFTVEYTSPESQLGHLEVFEIDVSDGAGFPPPRDVVPVVLQRTS